MSRTALLTMAGVASILFAALLVVTFAGGGGGAALRSAMRPPAGLEMSKVLELRIHAKKWTFHNSGSTSVAATLTNRSARAVSLALRSGGLPAQVLFRWRIQLPSGQSYLRGVNLNRFGDRELEFRGLKISQSLGPHPSVQPQTLQPGESVALELRFPGSTHMPVEQGEHRVVLEYQFRLADVNLHDGPTDDGMDLKPFNHLPTTPAFPEGTVTSNGLLLTRQP